MNRWKTLQSFTALDHPLLKVEQALRQSDTGLTHQFVLLRSPDWVNVVPLTGDGQVVLIRQWRQGSQEETLEIPGGIVDPGETPQEAGARELREETGYLAGAMTYLGQVNPNPALFDNRCHTFLATGCRLDGPMRLEPSERIEVARTPVDDLVAMVRDGRIQHSLVIAALCFYWLHEGRLGPAAQLALAPGRELG